MKQLAILLPNGASTLSSLILTVEVLETANAYFVEKGKKAVFHVQLVGNASTGSITHGAFRIQQDLSCADSTHFDLIIVPALGEHLESAVAQNGGISDWLAAQYKAGAEVASLCTGAFLLASAGLLEGKQCSTHWAYAHQFQRLFPGTQLTIEKVITDEHGVYTTGGAISSLNLVLHLIEKYYDRDTAIFCAKVFEIDLDRKSQSAYILFSGQKNHEDTEIKKAQLFMESQVGDKIAMDELSAKFSIDRRNFDRRFRKATGNSPLEYMQRLKVEAAKKSLETSRKTVNEVMYEVGYADIKTFREVFKKNTGLSPLEYRGKYNKEARRR